jgi:hypothetical protein
MFRFEFKSRDGALKESSPPARQKTNDDIEDAVDPSRLFSGTLQGKPSRFLRLEDENGDTLVVPHPADEYIAIGDDSILHPSKRQRVDAEPVASPSSSSSSAVSYRAVPNAPFDEKQVRLTRDELFRARERQLEEDFKATELRMQFLSLNSGNRDDEEDTEEQKAMREDQKKYARVPLHAPILKLAAMYKSAEQERKLSERLVTRRQYTFDPNTANQLSGETRYKRVLAMVEIITKANGFSLSNAQRLFVKEYLYACAPLVFGTDWRECSMQFLQKHKLAKIIYQVMALTPRRFGKTVSICVFVLALIMSVPRLRVIVISQGKRASLALVKKIKEFLWKTPGGRERLACDSVERVEVIPESEVQKKLSMNDKKNHPDLSGVTGYPSTVDGKQSFVCVLYRTGADKGERERERERQKTCTPLRYGE